MNLVVDHSRHQDAATGIENLGAIIRIDRCRDLLDSLTFYQDVSIANLALVQKSGVGYQQLVH